MFNSIWLIGQKYLKNRKLQKNTKQNIDNLQTKTVVSAQVENFVFSLPRGIPL